MKTLTYTDYLKKGNKVNPSLLAAKGAMPKTSRGDTSKDRMYNHMQLDRIKGVKIDWIGVKQLHVSKNGYLKIKGEDSEKIE